MLTSLLPNGILPCFATELSDSKGMLMAVITCSGILIVFVILLLLIFIFYAYGGLIRVFTASGEKKAAAKKAAAEKARPTSAAPAPAVEPTQPADGEIPPEIIAVIAAAVAAVSGGKKLAVRKVSRAQRQTGVRSAWASSGIYENTRPF